MSLRDLFSSVAPNPAVIGRVNVTKDDIEPAKLDAYESKLRRARQYLTDHNITVRPICRTLQTEE